ncbi:MAG: pyridoxamine 5'-phosphate oxidase family protein [Proteobacteria bacterium]|nr:pyridoxamine 5'-phosphate oxidase family protein [Pseudomonadota bacterium]
MKALSEHELRSAYGYAEGLAVAKSRPTLDKHSRHFISLSPFLVISTQNTEGKADVSPRGDPPGFVHVVDDKHFVIPDRPGNNRLDTISNIVSNPNVACLFFIPGFDDTLRVAGRAYITDDAAALGQCVVQGKTPKTGIVVEIEEVFLHCAKALRRSKLWQGDYKQDRAQMPSIARIILEQTCASGVDEDNAKVLDKDVETNYRTEMY